VDKGQRDTEREEVGGVGEGCGYVLKQSCVQRVLYLVAQGCRVSESLQTSAAGYRM